MATALRRPLSTAYWGPPGVRRLGGRCERHVFSGDGGQLRGRNNPCAAPSTSPPVSRLASRPASKSTRAATASFTKSISPPRARPRRNRCRARTPPRSMTPARCRHGRRGRQLRLRRRVLHGRFGHAHQFLLHLPPAGTRRPVQYGRRRVSHGQDRDVAGGCTHRGIGHAGRDGAHGAGRHSPVSWSRTARVWCWSTGIRQSGGARHVRRAHRGRGGVARGHDAGLSVPGNSMWSTANRLCRHAGHTVSAPLFAIPNWTPTNANALLAASPNSLYFSITRRPRAPHRPPGVYAMPADGSAAPTVIDSEAAPWSRWYSRGRRNLLWGVENPTYSIRTLPASGGTATTLAPAPAMTARSLRPRRRCTMKLDADQ